MIIKRFKDIGLTSYEAKSYLSLIEKDTLTVSEISKIAGIPRANAYEALEKLMSKGLCIAKPGKVRRYSASNPSFIKEKFLNESNQVKENVLEGINQKERKLSEEFDASVRDQLKSFGNKENDILTKYQTSKEKKLKRIEEEKKKKLEKYEAAKRKELEKLEQKKREELHRIETAQKIELDRLKKKQEETLAKKEASKQAKLAQLSQKAKELSYQGKCNLENVNNLVDELSPIYENGRTNDKPLEYYIEVMKNPGQINKKISQLMDEAQKEILCFEKPAFGDAIPWPPKEIKNMLSESAAAMARAIKRGVKARSIYELSTGGERRKWQLRMLGQYARTGEQIRIVKEAPIKAIIVDSKKIYFALEDPLLSQTSYISQIVDSGGLAMGLKMLFEKLWAEAEDYETFLKRESKMK